MYKLEEKVIVVVGGAGLLGRSFVHAILESGGIVVIADILNDNYQQTVNQFT